MNTKLITLLLAIAGLGLIAEESTTDDLASEPGAVETPAAITTEPEPATDAPTIQDENTDEIDLEEDDSALAARKPQIKGDIPEGNVMALVDIECDEATLADILRQFRKTTGANIISDDSTNLQRRVSVSLRRVPWLQGLQSILGSRGFRLDERENIFRVVEDLQAVPVSTRTFQLNHAGARELTDLFNKSYGAKDPQGRIIHPIATSFEEANVVVVTATEKVISDCEAIIKSVDKAVAQIYIEARFIELDASAMHKLGIKWDSLTGWGATLKDLNGGMSVANGHGQTVNITKGLSTAGGTKLDNSRNFSGTLSVDNFSLALSAFEKMDGTKIFSNPKVIVSNGKEAKISETTKYPNLTITSQRNTSTTTAYTDYTAKLEQIMGDKEKGLFAGSAFYSWGIELSVTPRISPDGIISVEITPSISQLDTDVTEDGFYKVQGGSSGDEDPNTAAYGKYPIIKLKEITTNFSMKDGSTAVIGGLTRTVEQDIDSGIPGLRHIPWIGPRIFGWKSRQKQQKEIIICVTLGIANPEALPSDMGLPTNAVYGREYTLGIRKEPGLRGSAAEAMKLDTRPLEEQNKDNRGKVSITPAR